MPLAENYLGRPKTVSLIYNGFNDVEVDGEILAYEKDRKFHTVVQLAKYRKGGGVKTSPHTSSPFS
jgi:hypothetical protein